MNVKRIVFLSMGIVVLLVCAASAQVKVSDNFRKLLDEVHLEFMTPLEARYKSVNSDNLYFNCHFAMWSRKERLEIRYFIASPTQDELLDFVPHVDCIRMVTHLATNDQDVVISGLDVPDTLRTEGFNADWAKVFFFTPKKSFSPRTHCKMLALFKEGYGMAYVFFLFDKADKNLDNRFVALRFDDSPLD